MKVPCKLLMDPFDFGILTLSWEVGSSKNGCNCLFLKLLAKNFSTYIYSFPASVNIYIWQYNLCWEHFHDRPDIGIWQYVFQATLIYLAKYQHSFNFISILSNEISKQLSHSFLKIFVNDSLPDCWALNFHITRIKRYFRFSILIYCLYSNYKKLQLERKNQLNMIWLRPLLYLYVADLCSLTESHSQEWRG